jgi:hypothetical protein
MRKCGGGCSKVPAWDAPSPPTLSSRKFGWMLSSTRNAEHEGQLLLVRRCVLRQLKQNVWPQGVTKGSEISSTHMGQRKSSAGSAPAAAAVPALKAAAARGAGEGKGGRAAWAVWGAAAAIAARHLRQARGPVRTQEGVCDVGCHPGGNGAPLRALHTCHGALGRGQESWPDQGAPSSPPWQLHAAAAPKHRNLNACRCARAEGCPLFLPLMCKLLLLLWSRWRQGFRGCLGAVG